MKWWVMSIGTPKWIVNTQQRAHAISHAMDWLTLKVLVTTIDALEHFEQDNYSTVGGDGGCRVGEVRAGTTSPMPDHKGFKLQ